MHLRFRNAKKISGCRIFCIAAPLHRQMETRCTVAIFFGGQWKNAQEKGLKKELLGLLWRIFLGLGSLFSSVHCNCPMQFCNPCRREGFKFTPGQFWRVKYLLNIILLHYIALIYWNSFKWYLDLICFLKIIL